MKKTFIPLRTSLIAVVASMIVVLSACDKTEPKPEPTKPVDETPKVEYLADSLPGNSNAVLEEYTGVRCTYCPDGHRRAQKFADENPGRVVLINVHTGSYAAPATGWPNFNTKFGAPLATMSGLSGYPAGSMNRFTFDGAEGTAPYFKQTDVSMALSRIGFAAAGANRLSQPTNVNMGMKTEFDAATRVLTVTVELYYTGDETLMNFLNIAVLENGVVGKQVDGGVIKEDYVHNHMLRYLITGQWGEKIEVTTKGHRYKKSFTYTVPDTWVADNLEIAAFVTQQNNGKKYPIINGIQAKLK